MTKFGKIKIAVFLLFAAIFVTPAFAQGTGSMKVKLYFTDTLNNSDLEDCGKVRAVTRSIPKTKAPAATVLRELFQGATKDEEAAGLSSAFKPETADVLISVNIKNGSAYVNLRETIYEKMSFVSSSCGGLTFHAPILATLRQFPAVKRVYYAIEGHPADYYEWTQAGECPDEIKDCSGKNFIDAR